MTQAYYVPGKTVVRETLPIAEVLRALSLGDTELTSISEATWERMARHSALTGLEFEQEQATTYLKVAARIAAIEQMILNVHNLSRDTTFPSTQAMLEAEISCREHGGRGAWAFYWMEGGCELTFFPGDEGPQEVGSVQEAIGCIGGDRPCTLTPTSLKRFGVRNSGAKSTYSGTDDYQWCPVCGDSFPAHYMRVAGRLSICKNCATSLPN